MKIFLAGIIQGSHAGDGTHPQDYREPMRRALLEAFPGAEIYDPVAEHPASVGYGEDKGRQVFFGLMDAAARHDLLAAWLPLASMGTAIEIWEAGRAGVFVAAVTPMRKNWVIRFLCDALYPDLAALERACRDGSLRAAFDARRAAGAVRPHAPRA